MLSDSPEKRTMVDDVLNSENVLKDQPRELSKVRKIPGINPSKFHGNLKQFIADSDRGGST